MNSYYDRELATEQQKDLLCSVANASFNREVRFRMYFNGHKKPISEDYLSRIIEDIETMSKLQAYSLLNARKGNRGLSNAEHYFRYLDSVKLGYFHQTRYAHYKGYFS